MDVSRIRAFYYERPIHPFTVHLASGDAVVVRHPELMAINEEDGVIVLADKGQLEVLDIASITRISQDYNKPTRVES